MPEVNLVPMMDVIMTILTFFIILSMTLRTGQQVIGINLPTAGAGATAEDPTKEPLIIGLDAQGVITIAGQPATDVDAQVQNFLGQNPQGTVLLKADQSLSYGEIVKLLDQLRRVGGDRVSLAIESAR
jgi:biopolymer transport protein ExbD